jgi:hypothetical protein
MIPSFGDVSPIEYYNQAIRLIRCENYVLINSQGVTAAKANLRPTIPPPSPAVVELMR